MKIGWNQWLAIQGDIGEEVVVRDFESRGEDPWNDDGNGNLSFTDPAQDVFNDVTDEIEGVFFEVSGVDEDFTRGFAKVNLTKSQVSKMKKEIKEIVGFTVDKFFK
jgi:hypothetical protein